MKCLPKYVQLLNLFIERRNMAARALAKAEAYVAHSCEDIRSVRVKYREV